MRRVLVTGATGFIGRNIVAALRGHTDFTVLTTARSGAVDYAGVDLASAPEAEAVLAKVAPHVIVHCVGMRHGLPQALRRSNVATLDAVLRAAARQPLPARIVTIGTAAEYGGHASTERFTETASCAPSSSYGRTKLAATHLALRYAACSGRPVTVLRVFNVAGPGMRGLLGEVIDSLGGNGPAIDWEKEAHSLPLVRDFMPVEDVAKVCRLVLESESAPSVLNVCSGVGRSFGEVLDQLQTIVGGRIGHPKSIRDAGGIVGDPSLCERMFGYFPTADISRALRQAVETAALA